MSLWTKQNQQFELHTRQEGNMEVKSIIVKKQRKKDRGPTLTVCAVSAAMSMRSNCTWILSAHFPALTAFDIYWYAYVDFSTSIIELNMQKIPFLFNFAWLKVSLKCLVWSGRIFRNLPSHYLLLLSTRSSGTPGLLLRIMTAHRKLLAPAAFRQKCLAGTLALKIFSRWWVILSPFSTHAEHSTHSLNESATRKPLTTQRSCWRSAEKQGQTGADSEIWEPPWATADASALKESASWKPCSLGECVLTEKFSKNSIQPSICGLPPMLITHYCLEGEKSLFAHRGKQAATDVSRVTSWPLMHVFVWTVKWKKNKMLAEKDHAKTIKQKTLGWNQESVSSVEKIYRVTWHECQLWWPARVKKVLHFANKDQTLPIQTNLIWAVVLTHCGKGTSVWHFIYTYMWPQDFKGPLEKRPLTWVARAVAASA